MKIKTILCPTDFSDPAEQAFRAALELAGDYAAELLLVHVMEYFPPLLAGGKDPVAQFQDSCRQLEDEACARLDQMIAQAKQDQIKVTPLVKIGHPAAQISEWADKYGADLIVVASHGRTGWRKAILGSVTERLLVLTARPIWIIHAAPPKQAVAGRHP